MYYDRKIKYLDYCERGERIRGGGHAKLEARDGRLRMELAVTGMHATDSFSRDVNLCTDKKEFTVGVIDISEGRGSYRQQWNQLENIGGSGIRYEELCGIRIPLGAGREISCRWPVQNGNGGSREVQEKEEIKAAESKSGRLVIAERGAPGVENKEKKDIVRGGERGISESPGGEEKGGIGREVRDVSESENRNRESSMADSENGMAESRTRGGEREERYMGESRSGNVGGSVERGERDISGSRSGNVGGSIGRGERDISGSRSGSVRGSIEREAENTQEIPKEEAGKRKTIRLMENKWAQLWAIYPHIKPFNDEREYISIGPSDFVLFSEASYKMVNNSFLLHGFYNYNHLLLARVERRGEAMYYIGVPGNFYEKEKQVAIMFGFESFECAEEPAQAGDFGYYMMRTGL